jgi:hypothetical protein
MPIDIGAQTIQFAAVCGTKFSVVTSEGRLFVDGQFDGEFPGIRPVPVNEGFAFYSSQLEAVEFRLVDRAPFSFRICLEKVLIDQDAGIFLYLKSPSLIWKGYADQEKPHSLYYETKAAVLALAISNRFRIAVISCEDWKVRIRSLSNGNKVSTFDLVDENAEKILITRAFGFIFAVTKTRLILLSVNGLLIQEIYYSFPPIVAWFTFASAVGIDYVGFVAESGEIRYFEAFYPENLVSVHNWPGAVAASYDGEAHGFKLLHRQGFIHFVQHELAVEPVDT